MTYSKQQMDADARWLVEHLHSGKTGDASIFKGEGWEICMRAAKMFCVSGMTGIAFAFSPQMKAKYPIEVRTDLLNQSTEVLERGAQLKFMLATIKTDVSEEITRAFELIFVNAYQEIYDADTNLRTLAKTLLFEIEKDVKNK
jgi:hypothetical protein